MVNVWRMYLRNGSPGDSVPIYNYCINHNIAAMDWILKSKNADIQSGKITINSYEDYEAYAKFEPDFDDKVKEKMAGLMTIIMRAVKTTNENNKNGYILHIGHLDEEMGGTRLPIKSTEIANDFNVFQNNFIKLEKEKEKENK